MSRQQGIVKWFSNAKGYGFLGYENGTDVFCHYSEIQSDGYKTLTEAEAVTFEIVQGVKGPQAEQVLRAGEQGQVNTLRWMPQTNPLSSANPAPARSIPNLPQRQQLR
jgi:CspA family cold shock protein